MEEDCINPIPISDEQGMMFAQVTEPGIMENAQPRANEQCINKQSNS
jgi:hypothetical protein